MASPRPDPAMVTALCQQMIDVGIGFSTTRTEMETLLASCDWNVVRAIDRYFHEQDEQEIVSTSSIQSPPTLQRVTTQSPFSKHQFTGKRLTPSALQCTSSSSSFQSYPSPAACNPLSFPMNNSNGCTSNSHDSEQVALQPQLKRARTEHSVESSAFTTSAAASAASAASTASAASAASAAFAVSTPAAVSGEKVDMGQPLIYIGQFSFRVVLFRPRFWQGRPAHVPLLTYPSLASFDADRRKKGWSFRWPLHPPPSICRPGYEAQLENWMRISSHHQAKDIAVEQALPHLLSLESRMPMTVQAFGTASFYCRCGKEILQTVHFDDECPDRFLSFDMTVNVHVRSILRSASVLGANSVMQFLEQYRAQGEVGSSIVVPRAALFTNQILRSTNKVTTLDGRFWHEARTRLTSVDALAVSLRTALDPAPEDEWSVAAKFRVIPELELSSYLRLTVQLRDYQRQTLLWALHQERPNGLIDPFWSPVLIPDTQPARFLWYSPLCETFRTDAPPQVSGGFICEDMGLGKTLECTALICANPATSDTLACCEDGPLPPHRRATKATLIVTPTSLVGQWFGELTSKTSPEVNLRVLCWHGPHRTQDANKLCDYDVVLTSYSLLDDEATCLLQRVQWHRIIMDESHAIKDATTSMSRHAASLHSQRRWLLSATPVIHSIRDMFSQLRFFHIPIISTDRDLATSVQTCLFSAHSNRLSLRTTSAAVSKFDRETCIAVLHRIMREITIRHTKEQSFNGRLNLISLPPSTVEFVHVALSVDEQAAYDRLRTFTRLRFHEIKQRGNLASRSLQLTNLLLPLRQVCSGGPCDVADIQRRVGELMATMALTSSVSSQSNMPFNLGSECSICLDQPMEGPLVTACRHMFCGGCIRRHLERSPRCPICRTNCSIDGLRPAPTFASLDLSSIDMTEPACVGTASVEFRSKLDHLLKMLCARHGTGSPGASQSSDSRVGKSVVFTEFSRTRRILQDRLRGLNIGVALLEGSQSANQRKIALNRFASDPGCTVLILSLRAGGLGLTLTQADHVYLMEPGVSRDVMQQAIDRVNRPGQTRPTRVVHFIVKDTVEELLHARLHPLHPNQKVDARIEDDTWNALLA